MKRANVNLETNQYLTNCDSEDVVAIDTNGLFHIKRLCSLIVSAIDNTVINFIANTIARKLGQNAQTLQWFGDGERCKILKAGSSGWQEGKLKLKMNFTLEFIPDEPEPEVSPLDEVRQELQQNKI